MGTVYWDNHKIPVNTSNKHISLFYLGQAE